MEKGFGLAHLLFYSACCIERSACKSLTVKQFVVTAFKDNFAPGHTCARTYINNMVGDFDHFLVMLHEDDRVAVVFQFLHRLLHQQNVVVVEAHAGFVKDIHYVRQRRVDVFCDFAALRLAARKCSDGAVQSQITQPDFLQCGQAFNDGVFYVFCKLIVNGFHPLSAVADAHCSHFGDVHAVDFAGADFLVEACSFAVGAGAHRQHRVEYGSVEKAFLRIDDAAVHSRDETFVFGTFRPIGGRVFQSDLRRVEEQIEFFGRVVLDFLVEVEKAAVGIANPAPAALAEGDIMNGVLVVERLVEIYQLVDVQLTDFAQTGAAGTTPRRVIEREGIRIAHKRLTDTRKQQAKQGVNVCICAYCGA